MRLGRAETLIGNLRIFEIGEDILGNGFVASQAS
jgi:hypothetical protein